jgi:hypothetical protein
MIEHENGVECKCRASTPPAHMQCGLHDSVRAHTDNTRVPLVEWMRLRVAQPPHTHNATGSLH